MHDVVELFTLPPLDEGKGKGKCKQLEYPEGLDEEVGLHIVGEYEEGTGEALYAVTDNKDVMSIYEERFEMCIKARTRFTIRKEELRLKDRLQKIKLRKQETYTIKKKRIQRNCEVP